MANDKLVSRMLLIGLAVVVLAILITQYTNKNSTNSKQTQQTQQTQPSPIVGKYENYTEPSPFQAHFVKSEEHMDQQPPLSNVLPNESSGNELYKAVDFETQSKINTCPLRDKNNVEDLLPKDAANSPWAQVNPAGQGSVVDKNLLTAGYLVGINTVGQTLKNANYQIRSDPPIEKINVGPWGNSTIEYDVNRRHFEIGSC